MIVLNCLALRKLLIVMALPLTRYGCGIAKGLFHSLESLADAPNGAAVKYENTLFLSFLKTWLGGIMKMFFTAVVELVSLMAMLGAILFVGFFVL